MEGFILHTTPKSELRDLIADVVKEQIHTFFEKKNTPDTALISRRETARRLNISLPTLHSYTKEGIIPSVRLGSTVKYRVCDILDVSNNIAEIKHSRYKR